MSTSEKRCPEDERLTRRPPGAISFGEVIRAIEGPLALIGCASLRSYKPCADCPDEPACALRRVMLEARDQLAGVLDQRSLADAIAGGFKAELVEGV